MREIVANLNGEVLTAPDKIDSTYETILIGAMGCESALIYARRAANKLVIVGGDRVDIILSTLETPTIAMILTGGIHPGSRVLAKAEEKGVPIILVNYDTYTTVQMISRLSGRIKPEDVKRISMVKELISRDVDYKAIMED
ncbi:MAG: DRTGG domain-containing protein [Candidatus Nezhaarchaeales archaeon]